ncbi:MAG: putative Zn-dependent metalloprotease, SprT family [Verrucomicrobia bacterium]|nr:MAG: putative Zn-dependent metalloprotease, SprT family [Verrucomicrobiota bacterium]
MSRNLPFSRQQLELFFPAPDPPAPSDAPLPVLPAGEDADLTGLSRRLVAALGLHDLAKRVVVLWNPRLRTTAGRAYRNRAVVELNPQLVRISPEEIDRTLRHELAHLVAAHRAGRRRIPAHGREWRIACSELGIPGESRCHDLPFQRRPQRRRFAYVCPVCQHRLLRVRRIKRAAACYHCCRAHNQGRFDARFQLIEARLKESEVASRQS